MSVSLLLLGLLIGMRHAVETDHLAAVATLASRSRSLTEAVRQGAAWGIGHTLTLFLFGSVVLLLDTIMPVALAHVLELLVGIMLVGLGADVLFRVARQKVHFHIHRHPDGAVHFHAHSHAGETGHDPQHHSHEHPAGFPLRALLVGLMHGMAGSAALIVLTLQTVRSPWLGLAYIALFGLGSMIGMALLSVAISIPLRASARGMTWLHNGLQVAVGLATVTIGAALILETSRQPSFLF